ncbi:MAG TPA: sigma-70 family RNA polymerase sigma factor [Acidimicrobiales bacterium]|nr:sigma-70 family RNA polymerase sigma factor [Acidimicrobiales bacterium]
MQGGDEVLVARLAAGDDEALGELFDRHGPFVMGVARRVTGDQARAEEVLQDVIGGLWQHPERYEAGRGSLRAFLGVQARRRAIDAVRSDSRRRLREERSACLDAPLGRCWPGDEDDPGGAVAESVRRAIDRLPLQQRQAVELAFWQGRTYREVAQVLGIPEGTAKSRLRMAQAKLSQWLAPVAVGSP